MKAMLNNQVSQDLTQLQESRAKEVHLSIAQPKSMMLAALIME